MRGAESLLLVWKYWNGSSKDRAFWYDFFFFVLDFFYGYFRSVVFSFFFFYIYTKPQKIEEGKNNKNGSKTYY